MAKKLLPMEKLQFSEAPKLRKLTKLKPLLRLMDDFFVFDTEKGVNKNGVIHWKLDGRPETFIFGCIVGKNFRKVIWSPEEFIEEFKHPRYKNKKVFAHNAEFDLTSIYGNIFSLDPKAIFNGKFISATNGNCLFADSLNIYRAKVSEIGELLGLEKIGMDEGNYESSDWNKPGQKEKDINGCFRDCEIIYEALLQIFEDSGDIKITQASLSMTYFRRHHLEYDIEHNENTKYFWDSYFGGRVECFKMGKTNSTVIDINSSYPYAMKYCKFPNPKYLKVNSAPTLQDLERYLETYEGLAYCKVYSPDTYFGLLPVKSEGKLIFPVGTFSGCWNFNELRYAIEQGLKVLEVSKIVFSEPMESPFVKYVDFVYFKRVTSQNEFEKYRLKIFANSLYGKFAQRIEEETIYIKDLEKEIDLIEDLQRKKLLIKIQTFSIDRKDCFLIVKSTKKFSLAYSIPSFASYITSFSRVYLLKKLFELKNNRVVYCDTDSVFYEIDNNSPNDTTLGGWKRENKIITEILGLKNYRYLSYDKVKNIWVDSRKIKGVPKSAKNTAPDFYEYENLIKAKEALRRKSPSQILTKRTKQILGLYTKRVVLPNGETQPITL